MKISPEFRKFCEEREIAPERLLEQFQADVAQAGGSAGSNERGAASAYLELVIPVVVKDMGEYFRQQREADRQMRSGRQLPE